jgi:hypothetical protein
MPLLRSETALNRAAKKLLSLFGDTEVQQVYSTCGPEQEYFLIDKGYYRLRPDLQLTGRTLIGASSPKGQQLEDHYFGSIKDRMLNYMKDYFEREMMKIVSLDLLEEMKSVVREDGFIGAPGRAKDDRVIAAALGHGGVCRAVAACSHCQPHHAGSVAQGAGNHAAIARDRSQSHRPDRIPSPHRGLRLKVDTHGLTPVAL